jgi:hypothetical protein
MDYNLVKLFFDDQNRSSRSSRNFWEQPQDFPKTQNDGLWKILEWEGICGVFCGLAPAKKHHMYSHTPEIPREPSFLLRNSRSPGDILKEC